MAAVPRRSVQFGDILTFESLPVTGDVLVSAPGRSKGFRIQVLEVHDLREPANHGFFRTPTAARLNGA
jgi:hypothetical protein